MSPRRRRHSQSSGQRGGALLTSPAQNVPQKRKAGGFPRPHETRVQAGSAHLDGRFRPKGGAGARSVREGGDDPSGLLFLARDTRPRACGGRARRPSRVTDLDSSAYGRTRAADGNRTRIIALEGRGSAIELPPRARTFLPERSCADDSLHRGRRTCPSRRVWLSNSDPGAPGRCRTTCRLDGRTRAKGSVSPQSTQRCEWKYSARRRARSTARRCFTELREIDAPLPVGRVVLLLVRGPTGPAVVVSLSEKDPSPGEVVDRLHVATATTSASALHIALDHARAAYRQPVTRVRGKPIPN